MDILQGLTPQLLSIYQTVNPYVRSANNMLFTLKSYLAPLLLPLLNRGAVLAQDSPAIITVGLLLLLFVISLQILNLARRIVVFWTRILFQILFYGGLVVVGMVVWQRGLGRTAGDLADWALEIQQVWLMEYRRWEGYQNQGRAGARAGNYNVRTGNAGTGWRR